MGRSKVVVEEGRRNIRGNVGEKRQLVLEMMNYEIKFWYKLNFNDSTKLSFCKINS